MDEPFIAWVSNAVANVSGIYPRAIACCAGKCVLTFTESRYSSCQVPKRDFFNCSHQASMRFSSEVVTNLTTIH